MARGGGGAGRRHGEAVPSHGACFQQLADGLPARHVVRAAASGEEFDLTAAHTLILLFKLSACGLSSWVGRA